MDARKAAWITPALIAGAAQALAARSREKLTIGRRYLAAGERKLGGFLLEQARVDAELASLRAATTRLRTLAAQPLRD